MGSNTSDDGSGDGDGRQQRRRSVQVAAATAMVSGGVRVASWRRWYPAVARSNAATGGSDARARPFGETIVVEGGGGRDVRG